MMLQLAKWLMQERRQANIFILVNTIISVFFPPGMILASAAATLVTLRHGLQQGLITGMWGMIPALVFALYWQSPNALFLLCISFISGYCLRATQSWSITVIALTAQALIAALLLQFFAGEALSSSAELLKKILENVQQPSASMEQQAVLAKLKTLLTPTMLAGMTGAFLVTIGMLSLALGRSWQAALYNPGGFQLEFHQLRLGRLELLTVIVASFALFSLGEGYQIWGGVALFPLLIAGIALCHAIAKQKQLAKPWYVVFYTMLILVEPLRMILVLVAVMDVSINFRQRFKHQNS